MRPMYSLKPLSDPSDRKYRDHYWFQVSNVLRPLTWIGFLDETRISENRLADRVYCKTLLWSKCLTLDTDRHLVTSTKH
ncbi:hypothetical protein SAMN05216227_10892 [Pseudorhodobacter antarcticus]|uniref:Uncharacterized protein n=1 Tax=Pseudorhodobacter antarcticus TaxID=1077947 RepID=A0A1H8NLC8_9RHOB|nr:hypothetical protein SAMN05216227_10892 [Pseudorhodobacter antarcticus]